MKTFLIVCSVVVIAAAGATWFRFQSFDPCIWMEKEMSKQTGLPMMVAEAKVKTEFLLQGISDPTASQCLGAWWRYRMDDAIENQKKNS